MVIQLLFCAQIAAGAMLLGQAAVAPPAAPPAAPLVSSQWLDRQASALRDRGQAQGWSASPSGLRWRRIKGDGSGAHPAAADSVVLHYAGRLVDGTEFDSSIARGEPVTLPLSKVIMGWREGVPLMAVGDTFEFAVPSGLAYGVKGIGPIPGNATLLFTIELIAIAPARPS
ncbi:FKBP-type peptidyl-prolyl cis-trans isomerase [Sphingomonas alpina]|uniref:Peptidyl-prolyl cis-trans isomerase n=1 Tax=Sphingomonas alpina TaxID=653931 RepID=A0A7H0LIT5_9SPHN|nr:FKBP-type peptidyl-prolyl cis-trans isomerase [Sphingomonas alpina]QNQ09588.1 FKBP-type peptidyl-prolyl cis-trans isomerase [Sphingomonas alpina]